MASFIKTIKDRCVVITTDGDKLNKYIHETGMMIIRHAAEHGDCEAALYLANAMPKSMRRLTLVAWFAKYTPITVKLSDDGNAVGFNEKYKKLSPEEKKAAWNIEGADIEPFYLIAEKTKEAGSKPFDLAEMLKLVKQMGDKVQKQIDSDAVPADDLATAIEFRKMLAGLKVPIVKPEPANDDATKSDDGAPKEQAA